MVRAESDDLTPPAQGGAAALSEAVARAQALLAKKGKRDDLIVKSVCQAVEKALGLLRAGAGEDELLVMHAELEAKVRVFNRPVDGASVGRSLQELYQLGARFEAAEPSPRSRDQYTSLCSEISAQLKGRDDDLSLKLSRDFKIVKDRINPLLAATPQRAVFGSGVLDFNPSRGNTSGLFSSQTRCVPQGGSSSSFSQPMGYSGASSFSQPRGGASSSFSQPRPSVGTCRGIGAHLSALQGAQDEGPETRRGSQSSASVSEGDIVLPGPREGEMIVVQEYEGDLEDELSRDKLKAYQDIQRDAAYLNDMHKQLAGLVEETGEKLDGVSEAVANAKDNSAMAGHEVASAARTQSKLTVVKGTLSTSAVCTVVGLACAGPVGAAVGSGVGAFLGGAAGKVMKRRYRKNVAEAEANLVK